MKKEREGKERESPTQLIKISNFSHGSRVTKFRQQVNAHLAVLRHTSHTLLLDGCCDRERRKFWLLEK